MDGAHISASVLYICETLDVVVYLYYVPTLNQRKHYIYGLSIRPGDWQSNPPFARPKAFRAVYCERQDAMASKVASWGHTSELIKFWSHSFDYSALGAIVTNWTDFQAFSGKHTEKMAWNCHADVSCPTICLQVSSYYHRRAQRWLPEVARCRLVRSEFKSHFHDQATLIVIADHILPQISILWEE